MNVREWMKSPVHAVKPLDSVLHARELMERHRINQLPVIVEGRLVGIVTDRDLRDAFPSVFDGPGTRRRKPKVGASDPSQVTVEMAMTPSVITVGPETGMAEAAELMRRHRVGSLPVVENHRIVGILARSDVLDAFFELARRPA
jgi:acetoin utilization protein AcuB